MLGLIAASYLVLAAFMARMGGHELAARAGAIALLAAASTLWLRDIRAYQALSRQLALALGNPPVVAGENVRPEKLGDGAEKPEWKARLPSSRADDQSSPASEALPAVLAQLLGPLQATANAAERTRGVLEHGFGRLDARWEQGVNVLALAATQLEGSMSGAGEGLRAEVEWLRGSFEAMTKEIGAMAKAFAERPSPPPPARSLPATPADPQLELAAKPFIKVLLDNPAYQAKIVELAANPLCEAVEKSLTELLEESQRLYRQSATRRGSSSLRMKAWGEENQKATRGLVGIGPLLRRLRHLPAADADDPTMASFLAGVGKVELEAMGHLLAPSSDKVETETQVKVVGRRLVEGIVSYWLMPAVRLHQLLHEALEVEDPWAARQRNQPAAAPLQLESVIAAAHSLGFHYVHHPLYQTNPYKMQTDISDATPRYTLQQWLEGEVNADTRGIAIVEDTVGRVNTPRFDGSAGRSPWKTQILIITKGG